MRIRTHLLSPAGRNGHLAFNEFTPHTFAPVTATTYLDALADELRWWHWRRIAAVASALIVVRFLLGLSGWVGNLTVTAVALVLLDRYANRASAMSGDLGDQARPELHGLHAGNGSHHRFHVAIIRKLVTCDVEVLRDRDTAGGFSCVGDHLLSRAVADVVISLLPAWDGSVGELVDVARSVAGAPSAGSRSTRVRAGNRHLRRLWGQPVAVPTSNPC